MKTSLTLTCSIWLACVGLVSGQSWRTIDGTYNNLQHPDWGAAGAPMQIISPVAFADGVGAPAAPDRPNPRLISNLLFTQNTMAMDERGLSAFAWGFGQFVDHDITLSPERHDEVIFIPIPTGDPFFDPEATGTAVMPMNRSDYIEGTGTGPGNPRRFYNGITSFLDGSAVYGSDSTRAAWLRTFSGGKLKTSAGNLLPFNTITGEYYAPVDPLAPEMAMPFPQVEKYFVAGDVRANENVFLLAFHTLFVREHNRLCDELAAQHPDWTDEQLYQKARKLVGAILQAIVYEEWLPAVGIHLGPYYSYKPELRPDIMNEFATAAFRYGHTTINHQLLLYGPDGQPLPLSPLSLRDAFFNPLLFLEAGGPEPFFLGQVTQMQQDFDCKVVDDLRNFLFGAPGQGGFDLVALNIMRGRERGLPDYNTLRMAFGLDPIESFDELSSDPLMNMAMEMVYGDVDDIDPWVGMLAEDHMPDALFGETAMLIVSAQFQALRDGDRFYYENDPDLTPDEKAWIKNTRLADLIRRNSNFDLRILPDNVFFAQPLLITSVEDAQGQPLAHVDLWPNPALERIHVAFAKTGPADLRILDMLGREVLARSVFFDGQPLALDLPASLPAGQYVLVVAQEGRMGRVMFAKAGT